MNFSFYLPTRIEFGAGVLNKTVEEVKKLHGKNVLIVTDKGIMNSGIAKPIIDDLQSNFKVTLFDDVKSNPRDVDCQTAAALCRNENIDLIVAIGGGSAMDTAKTVGALVTNGGEVKDYIGDSLLKEPILPLICIPTTAGTGSEVTFFAVITDSIEKIKMSILDTKLVAKVALVDPNITKSLPTLLTASTGMDALTHAIEAYTCKLATPLTDIMALDAIRLISSSLRDAVKDGNNADAREKMMLGSLVAGIAFGNSDVAGVHCMAEAIGGLYDTPHGVANSIFLPYLMEFNMPSDPQKHADIARAMGLNTNNMSIEEAAMAGVEEVKKLSKDVGIPLFKDLPGVDSNDFELLAERSACNISNDSNCRPAGAAEYLDLFKKTFLAD